MAAGVVCPTTSSLPLTRELSCMRIALLEDEQDQADLVSTWLKPAGHCCQVFLQGKELVR